MKKITTHTMELKGSNYEIGRALGRYAASMPGLKEAYTSGFAGFTSQEAKEAQALFDRWCPGLTEELAGFADEVQASPEDILYYAMTYLRPNCSQLALLPSKTADHHPLLARNYEFNEEMEDFTLIKTSVNGRYSHLGTGVLSFGRDDGFNDQGLAITMSSCGFPVGAAPGMRRPALKGLQFWAVIRSLLENCRDTDEALSFLQDMPVAYNLNLILLDKSGRSALVETLDGTMISRRIDEASPCQALCATNHPVFEELAAREPAAMVHSLRRRQYLLKQIDKPGLMSRQDLKEMLLSPYPDGLCCHYYQEFFGTTKSMILDPLDGTIELCWGGRVENGWRTYRLADPLPFSTTEIEIQSLFASPDIFQPQPIPDTDIFH